MRYKITCCKDCPNRHGGCHSTCEKYKQERKEYDETMSEVNKKEAVQKGLNGFLFNNIEQMALAGYDVIYILTGKENKNEN